MESGKVEIDGDKAKTPSSEPVDTYKSIAEDAHTIANKEPPQENTKMSKLNGDSETDDGAQERMLKEGGKINSNKEAAEVKFIAENGDAKIDIETVKQAFAGMGKEELMKFANDPFWIRIRWIMFIAFWLLWAAMLAGAVAIIVMAPKCTAPSPKLWWEINPIVRLDVEEIGGLTAAAKFIKSLRDTNIKAISLAPIVRASSPGHTEDFKDINPEIGNLEDFKELIKVARENDQNIILELDPNHTSQNHTWFALSVNKTGNYADYYVWANGTTKVETNGQPLNPPNNWVRANDASMWEWNKDREQFYLHQFEKTQPDLNYHNTAVINEFSNVLKYWLNLGVTGFRLINTQYLTENRNLTDFEKQPLLRTQHLSDNVDILRTWRQVVANHTKNSGVFMITGDIPNEILDQLNDKARNETLVDLPEIAPFLSNATSTLTASAIKEGVIKTLERCPWPAWNTGDSSKASPKRLSPDEVESLTLMTMLLPGTPVISYSQTNYTWLSELTKARGISSFLYGSNETNIINGTVFVYSRLKSGNPGYLVAYQSSNQNATLDLSAVPQVPKDVSVVAFSSNYHQDKVAVKNSLPSKEIPISPKSTLVLTFVPKDENE